VAVRTNLRTALDALNTDRSRRTLTDAGRTEQREKALAVAREHLSSHRQALELARAMLERRDALTSSTRVLREARFVPDDPSVYDDQVRELRLLREELMRQRIREELRDLPSDALAATIREAGATQNHALLHVAESVVASRKRAGEQTQLDAAVAALIDARQNIEPPKDVQRLESLFAQIDGAARDLEAAVNEIATGRELDDAAASARRIEAMKADGDTALEIGQRFAAERQAERQVRKQRAAQHAERIVADAIAGDEHDAAQMTNPAA
jgi:hypothetical protein